MVGEEGFDVTGLPADWRSNSRLYAINQQSSKRKKPRYF